MPSAELLSASWLRSMAYSFVFLPGAERQLRALDATVARRILKKLQWLARQDNPLRFVIPLHHAKIGDIRFRIGDYRVVALVNENNKRIAVAAVGHRRNIYR